MVLLNELVINRFYCYDYAIKDTRKWTVFSLDGHGYIRYIGIPNVRLERL